MNAFGETVNFCPKCSIKMIETCIRCSAFVLLHFQKIASSFAGFVFYSHLYLSKGQAQQSACKMKCDHARALFSHFATTSFSHQMNRMEKLKSIIRENRHTLTNAKHQHTHTQMRRNRIELKQTSIKAIAWPSPLFREVWCFLCCARLFHFQSGKMMVSNLLGKTIHINWNGTHTDTCAFFFVWPTFDWPLRKWNGNKLQLMSMITANRRK